MKHIVAVFLLLILFNGYFARSQATDATISGIVLDPAGKVIPTPVAELAVAAAPKAKVRFDQLTELPSRVAE